jgi:hypothetical protein
MRHVPVLIEKPSSVEGKKKIISRPLRGSDYGSSSSTTTAATRHLYSIIIIIIIIIIVVTTRAHPPDSYL